MFLTKTKKSRYYQIVFFKDGKQTTKSTRTSDKKIAKLILDLFGKSFQETPKVSFPKKSIKLNQFSEEYIELLKLSASNAYIKRSVIPSFKHLLMHFGNVDLQKVTPQKAEKFLLVHFQKAKYSASLYLRVLKAAFRKAITWKYIDSNPFSEIKLPKIQHKPPIFMTVEELKLILDKTDRKVLKEIFMFTFLTGLRLAEVVNLTWDRINFDQNFLQVGSNSFTTKSKQIRFIPLCSPARKILLNRKPKRITHNNYHIFDKQSGFKYSGDFVSKKFKKAVRKAGLSEDIHFHTLRASFGSYLLQSGVPISHISKLLGHSSIAVTEKHYAVINSSNMINAIKSFNTMNHLFQTL